MLYSKFVVLLTLSLVLAFLSGCDKDKDNTKDSNCPGCRRTTVRKTTPAPFVVTEKTVLVTPPTTEEIDKANKAAEQAKKASPPKTTSEPLPAKKGGGGGNGPSSKLDAPPANEPIPVLGFEALTHKAGEPEACVVFMLPYPESVTHCRYPDGRRTWVLFNESTKNSEVLLEDSQKVKMILTSEEYRKKFYLK